MLAVLAAIAFLIGFIVRIVDVGFEFEDVWIWLLLGLTLFAAQGGVPWVVARRKAA